MLISRKTSVRQRQNKSEVTNKAKEATIYLYGDIGGWFGLDSEAWVKEFNNISADTIHVRIDSAGGDIFSARAMKTAIMQSSAKTVAHIDGLAASAASFLAMGADEIEIVDGGFLMIHNAMSLIDFLGYYNQADMENLVAELQKEIGLHEKINEAIANDYAKRTGQDTETVKGWMNDETWFSASEALENNFVNRVYDGEPTNNKYELSIYANVPESFAGKIADQSKRTIEKALRDAGLTNREAKKILAEGFKTDDIRDDVVVDEPDEHRDDEPVIDPPPAEDSVNELLVRAATITG